MSEALLSEARAAARLARELGADDAKVRVQRSRSVSVEWRDGRLDRVQERSERSLSIGVFVDGRHSAHATNDLRPDALQRFVQGAVAMTRVLEPDPHRGLPDPSRYARDEDLARDLDLFDATQEQVTSEQRMAEAEALETLFRERATGLPVISVSSSAGDRVSELAVVHTNGFEGTSRGTRFGRGGAITVRDADGRKPMGYAQSSRRHREDLDPPEGLAERAAERARHQLGAGKLATGHYTVVVDARAVGGLLRRLLQPLYGGSLQQGRSMWEGKLDTPIVSEALTLFDAPHVRRGLGSARFDRDGFATRRRPIIERGVLRSYLIDQYHARKLGMEPTGGSLHGFEWAYGERDPAALIADVGEGVFIDRFIGGNSDETTGELSLGCGGRRIEGGQLAAPVSEVNLSGRLDTLWGSLVALGDDPDPNGASACPTCVFEHVQLSGI